jgi:SAM-dependent methyltransferase
MSIVETVPPLYARRPPSVIRQIQDVALGAATPYARYINCGQDDDYVLAPGVLASGLAERLGTDASRPLRILDVGAGVGGFVLEQLRQGHVAHALSLHDYRMAVTRPELAAQARRVPDDAYIVGDAQGMHAIEQLACDYDLIVSRWTFPHLVDQLGTLEQVTERLAPHGIVAVANLHTDFGYAPALDGLGMIQTMRAAGFDTTGSIYTEDDPFVPLLIAQRGEDATALRFPVEFRDTAQA